MIPQGEVLKLTEEVLKHFPRPVRLSIPGTRNAEDRANPPNGAALPNATEEGAGLPQGNPNAPIAHPNASTALPGRRVGQ